MRPPRPDIVEAAARLWWHPYLPREAITSFQSSRLRRLVRRAYAGVAHTRERFDEAGVDPQKIRSLKDLRRIPITSKSELRGRPVEEIVDRAWDPESLVSLVTSGSTGRPFVIRRSPWEHHLSHLFRVRSWLEMGGRLGDRRAGVMLGDTANRDRRVGRSSRLQHRLGVLPIDMLSCVDPPEEILRRLEELDPDIIGGYPSVLERVALLAGGRFRGKRLRRIGTTGETLRPARRRAIERGFGVPVYDQLGAHECNVVAWECPWTGHYHVCDDNVIVEVLVDGRPAEEGELGELILTPLHSHAMPLIRYRIGDKVIKGRERCPCGRSYSTILGIEGRVREFFDLPDGREVHPLSIISPLFAERPAWLDQFQLVQESRKRFLLRVSLYEEPAAGQLEALAAEIRARLGDGAEFHIERVQEIRFGPSGKYKDCVNLLRLAPSS